MTNVIHFPGRLPAKAPAAPPNEEQVFHYHGQLDRDSDKLRKLLLRNFSDPEVIREWHETVERLRHNSLTFAQVLGGVLQ